MSPAGPTLSLSGVGFTYRDGGTALRGVDLEVLPGETVLLLGASGAGKSTLCLTANGLVPHLVPGAFEGSVRLRGLDTREHPVRAFAPHAGVVFQDFESQLFCTTVELDVAFGPENLALPRNELRRRVTEALARTGLAGYEGRFPAALSGGEKQRLAVASALALEPALLVFDEPASDLDPEGREEVHAVARRLREERGSALLVAELDATEAAGADRVAVLRSGSVALMGTPAEVLSRVPDLLEAGVRPPAPAEVTAALGLEPTADAARAADAIRSAGLAVQPAPRRDETPASGPVIAAARRLCFSYPWRPPALRSVDLEIRQGEFVAILGRNGSGKSTLARLLAGLLKPSAGAAEVSGRGAGLVFQNPDHQIFAETVEAEVAFGPRLQGLGEAEVEARVAEALAATGLSGRRRSDPFLLPKGGRQRVAVASVLATRPDVLLLDEPTTGLDYRETREMMDLVGRLNREGHAVVIVTHAMWVAAEYARRTIVMDRGEVLADGPTSQVFRQKDVLARAALRPPEASALAELLGLEALNPSEILAQLVLPSTER